VKPAPKLAAEVVSQGRGPFNLLDPESEEPLPRGAAEEVGRERHEDVTQRQTKEQERPALGEVNEPVRRIAAEGERDQQADQERNRQQENQPVKLLG
jgi:hypothetical protein